jgi:hypothetical protein
MGSFQFDGTLAGLFNSAEAEQRKVPFHMTEPADEMRDLKPQIEQLLQESGGDWRAIDTTRMVTWAPLPNDNIAAYVRHTGHSSNRSLDIVVFDSNKLGFYVMNTQKDLSQRELDVLVQSIPRVFPEYHSKDKVYDSIRDFTNKETDKGYLNHFRNISMMFGTVASMGLATIGYMALTLADMMRQVAADITPEQYVPLFSVDSPVPFGLFALAVISIGTIGGKLGYDKYLKPKIDNEKKEEYRSHVNATIWPLDHFRSIKSHLRIISAGDAVNYLKTNKAYW